MESFVLWSLKVWPARGLNNLISAASILYLCGAVKVQFSDPYKNVGKTKVLYNFKIVSILTFLKIVLLIVTINCKNFANLIYTSLENW
jgi:presenilin-like A22 family membrane protease